MIIALVLFGLAAMGGAYLANELYRGRTPPKPVAIAHGVLAAAGLVSLTLAALGGAADRGRLPLALFVAAALGGITLFSFNLRKKQPPIPIVVVHGVVALAAIVLLLFAVVDT